MLAGFCQLLSKETSMWGFNNFCVSVGAGITDRHVFWEVVGCSGRRLELRRKSGVVDLSF